MISKTVEIWWLNNNQKLWLLLQNSVAGQFIDSSGGSYQTTLPRAHDSSQVTWPDNHVSPLYNKTETENATPGIPVVYNHAYSHPQLRDLLLSSRANFSAVQSETETAAVSSEIPSMYNHTSPTYNHAQLRDLLLTSRAASSSSAQIETETTCFATSRDDVTAMTSRPMMTSPVSATTSSLRVKLCNAKLWRQFHACTNEMVITKAGR